MTMPDDERAYLAARLLDSLKERPTKQPPRTFAAERIDGSSLGLATTRPLTAAGGEPVEYGSGPKRRRS